MESVAMAKGQHQTQSDWAQSYSGVSCARVYVRHKTDNACQLFCKVYKHQFSQYNQQQWFLLLLSYVYFEGVLPACWNA